ncbi:hypothetical protein BDV3_003087 [Batrachochytrium dendrobatidis]
MNYGLNCSLALCNKLDFLPFVCQTCQCAYCPAHRFPDTHGCISTSQTSSYLVCPKCSQRIHQDKYSTDTETTDIDSQQILNRHIEASCPKELDNVLTSAKISCSFDGCSTAELWGVVCPSCTNKFCLAHRHKSSHNCPSIAQSAATKLEEQARIKAFVSQTLSKMPASNCTTPNTLNQPKANSKKLNPAVSLIKLKMHATGDTKILPENRVYLLCYSTELRTSMGVFYHSNTVIGRLLDLVASKANVKNTNNIASSGPPLGLFHGKTGNRLPNDKSLQDLLKSKVLSQGQCIVLDRSHEACIDVSNIPET